MSWVDCDLRFVALSSLLAAFLPLAGCTSSTDHTSPFARCPLGSEFIDGKCVVQAGIGINTVGYLPGRVKRATIPSEASTFEVRRSTDDSLAFEGFLTGPVFSSDVGRDVWVADFSGLDDAGEYYLTTDGELSESPTFRVGADVYDSLFDALMLGMYGQRCGVEVSFEWGGEEYRHAACHTKPASLEKAGLSGERDGTLGWHDAGDYGKYTVNAAFSAGVMLLAYEQFTDRLSVRPLDIPEAGSDVPDYLDEVSFSLQWMLKMQNPDGSVAHKLDTADFASFVMPSADFAPQYFSDWGSAATADFVAVMARAARAYEPYQADFAATCAAAAQASYDFVLQNPSKDPDLSSFRQQQYRTGAEDDLCWASCEMWETTGDETALRDCEARLGSAKFTDNWDWSNVQNLCMITYADSKRDDADLRDSTVLEGVVAGIVASADELAANAEEDPYGRGYLGNRYWGINGVYARTAVNLQTAYRFDPKPEYLDAATQQVDHLLGRNYFGRSQVTGIGHQPPLNPHHRPSVADNVGPPWPGLLVGGSFLTDKDRQEADPPAPGTTWEDSDADYENNEVAINWNAALIYAVAGFLE